MRHILYISYDGMTDPLGQSQVIPYLQGLAQKNFRIWLISCEKKDRFSAFQNQVKETLQNSNISWHPVMYDTFPPVLSSLVNVRKLRKAAQRIILQEGIHIVHCRSYLASLIGLEMKRKYNTRFVFDMRGFWADERLEGNIWNHNNPLFRSMYSYFKKKEKEFFTNADYTISLTENGKSEIQKTYPQASIQVIPCCADTGLFSLSSVDKTQKQKFAARCNLQPNDLVVSYLGSLGTWYMLDEMLLFFSRLLIVYPQARFLFITPDDAENIFQTAGKLNIAKDRIIIEKAARKEVPTLLSFSAFNLFFIRPTFSKKASSPTKLAEVLGMGIPVITNTGIGDVDTVLESSGCGILISDFSVNSYDKAITGIPGLLTKNKEVIRETALVSFSLEKGIDRYAEVYDAVG